MQTASWSRRRSVSLSSSFSIFDHSAPLLPSHTWTDFRCWRCLRVPGSGMFFWSFPSKAVQQKKNALADLQATLTAEQEKEKALKAQLTAARAERQQTKERKVKLEQLQTLKRRKRAAEEESKQFDQCDPERIKKLSQPCNPWTRRSVGSVLSCCSFPPSLRCFRLCAAAEAAAVVCRESANRWTENCQLLAAHFRKRGHDMKDEEVHRPQPAALDPLVRTALTLLTPLVPRGPNPSVLCCPHQMWPHFGLPKDLDTLE